MDLSLRNLILLARKWWWLLLLAPLLAGVSAYYTVSRQTPMYAASAIVEINPPASAQTADTFTTYDTNLVATYRALITTTAVLQPFIANNQLPYTEEALRAMISTSPIADTRLMKVTVSSPDPAEAARLANGVAAQFSAFAKERSAQLTSSYRQAVDQQIAKTNTDSQTTQQMIDDLLAGPDANSEETKVRLETLRANLTDLQSTYRELLVTANQMDLTTAGATTSVLVAQEASAPDAPYAPKVMLYTLLGLFAGACIAVGAIGLIEYLDNTVKVTTDFPALSGSPLLSVVGLVPNVVRGRDQLFVLNQPTSTPAEAIRLLRTNVEFAATTREIEAMMITSAVPGEGKSTVTANLGVALAQAGYETIIVDADLRRPSQHRIFDVRNDKGLTTLLSRGDLNWLSVAADAGVQNLWLIPSGPIPPNPADLLSLDRFGSVIREMTQAADIVLVDTSPVLAVSDPLVVSSTVRDVLVVSRASRTRIEALRRAIESLPKAPVRLVGVVVNQQSGRGSEGYYYYYSGYYGPNDGDQPTAAGTKRPPAFGRLGKKPEATAPS